MFSAPPILGVLTSRPQGARSGPIDTIEVEADEFGNTSAVGFGKFLGPNLFLRYVHVLGDDPTERVGVEYRLNDNFSVGSSVSSTGDSGVDLILRHDF